MPGSSLAPELVTLIAERFKALGDPARLSILNALRRGERTVSELTKETGFGQTNVSKHLASLYGYGLVTRRKDGLFVHYAIADDRVFLLCNIMCAQLRTESRKRQRVVA